MLASCLLFHFCYPSTLPILQLSFFLRQDFILANCVWYCIVILIKSGVWSEELSSLLSEQLTKWSEAYHSYFYFSFIPKAYILAPLIQAIGKNDEVSFALRAFHIGA